MLGIVLARAGQTALAAFFAERNNAIVLDLALNARVLLFTLSLGVLSALAVGIAPALRAARLDPTEGLHGGSRGVAGNRVSIALGRGLVIVQVALDGAARRRRTCSFEACVQARIGRSRVRS
jgi:hypothetical protein